MVTLPVTAFFVLALFKNTKEFSSDNYGTMAGIALSPQEVAAIGGTLAEQVIEMPGLGYAHFPKDIPRSVADEIIADFKRSPALDRNWQHWEFTVRKRVNKLKLTGLVAASVVIPGLVIQGLISVFVWVARGFAGFANCL